MGLTNASMGIHALDSGLVIERQSSKDKVIALAGNPNVGKSTVFNALTGMNQHTGNWPGKTVSSAQGHCCSPLHSYMMVDIPGTYSLMAHSTEEEVARNFICFGNPDAVVVVCDATCLERNLNLVLQTLEISNKVLVCVNLMDEADRKQIKLNLPLLSKRLGIPIVGCVARKRKSLAQLLNTLDELISDDTIKSPFTVKYPESIEAAIAIVEPTVKKLCGNSINSRWLSLKLLDQDESLINEINTYLGTNFLHNEEVSLALNKAKLSLASYGITDSDCLKDLVVSTLIKSAETLCQGVISYEKHPYAAFDRRLDQILTGRLFGYPVMLGLLALVFWLTLTGANYPSQLLSLGLFWIQDRLSELFHYLQAPPWLHGALVLGIYRVLAWVVSVMLPPMAIFFPLFTLLEDSGYLPRVAFNLDKPFKRCCACGKQALCMCMGLGCNAAGIIGCRIIDSPRERLLAILTNNFIPCNGRFPTLIALLTMFFVGTDSNFLSSAFSALLLTLLIMLGVGVTFGVTKALSLTILKGVPSSFTLELPPYRKPQLGKVILRSIFDRTLFVLGRAVCVAIPAGLIIWLMANITIHNVSLLNLCATVLNPFARLMGLDGIILIAFILSFPANEITIPIIIMAYLSQGSLPKLENLTELKYLLVENGWTGTTAVSTMLFSLFHWPCSTTLLTIKKETGCFKWTVLAAMIPTIIGILLCILFTGVTHFFP